MLLNAFGILAVVFLMMAVGAACAHWNILGENARTVLNRLVLRVGMPALIFNNLLTKYDRASLAESLPLLLIPLATLTAVFLISFPIARLLRIPPQRRAIFGALFTFSNSVFIGLPVCTAILGDDSLPLCLLYYLINTLFWWIVAAPRVAGVRSVSPKKLLSAPLVACVGTLILLFAGFRPPQILISISGYLGAIVTPLSMLFIGMVVYGMIRQGIRWERGYLAVLIGKMILAPALCLGICLAFGAPMPVTGAFFLQAAMPSQTQIPLWSAEYGQDVSYATGGMVICTLASFVMIPVCAAVLGFLQA